MPWTPAQAQRFTKKADTPAKARQWSKVANDALAHGASDASAIQQANGVVIDHPAGSGATQSAHVGQDH